MAADVEGLLGERGGVSDVVVVGPTASTSLGAILLIDPEAVKSSLDDLTASAGVRSLLSCTLADAHRDEVDRLGAVDYIDFGGTAHRVDRFDVRRCDG